MLVTQTINSTNCCPHLLWWQIVPCLLQLGYVSFFMCVAAGYWKLDELESKGYTRMNKCKAKELWEFWYNYAQHHCYHGDNCGM